MSYNIKNSARNQDNSRWFFYFVFGFLMLALSVNLVKLSKEYVAKRQLLKDNRMELADLNEQQNKLNLRLKQGQSRDFIENEARKLSLAKANEVIVVITTPRPRPTAAPTPTPYIANYQRWIAVFWPK